MLARIETLYTALREANPGEAAACYSANARFRDIAFRLCTAVTVSSRCGGVRLQSTGCGNSSTRWMPMITEEAGGGGQLHVCRHRTEGCGNSIDSTFAFDDGAIVCHRDWCNVMVWADQAYPFPKSLVVGLVGPLRR